MIQYEPRYVYVHTGGILSDSVRLPTASHAKWSWINAIFRAVMSEQQATGSPLYRKPPQSSDATVHCCIIIIYNTKKFSHLLKNAHKAVGFLNTAVLWYTWNMVICITCLFMWAVPIRDWGSVVAMVTQRWTLLFETHTSYLLNFSIFLRLNLQTAFLFLALSSAPLSTGVSVWEEAQGWWEKEKQLGVSPVPSYICSPSQHCWL